MQDPRSHYHQCDATISFDHHRHSCFETTSTVKSLFLSNRLCLDNNFGTRLINCQSTLVLCNSVALSSSGLQSLVGNTRSQIYPVVQLVFHFHVLDFFYFFVVSFLVKSPVRSIMRLCLRQSIVYYGNTSSIPRQSHGYIAHNNWIFFFWPWSDFFLWLSYTRDQTVPAVTNMMHYTKATSWHCSAQYILFVCIFNWDQAHAPTWPTHNLSELLPVDFQHTACCLRDGASVLCKKSTPTRFAPLSGLFRLLWLLLPPPKPHCFLLLTPQAPQMLHFHVTVHHHLAETPHYHHHNLFPVLPVAVFQILLHTSTAFTFQSWHSFYAFIWKLAAPKVVCLAVYCSCVFSWKDYSSWPSELLPVIGIPCTIRRTLC